jgi:hypothetical protein
MANKNFVVHNGLSVGALTIDAITGDLTTTGNITVSGDINITGTVVDSGVNAATIDDATALAIALGG